LLDVFGRAAVEKAVCVLEQRDAERAVLGAIREFDNVALDGAEGNGLTGWVFLPARNSSLERPKRAFV